MDAVASPSALPARFSPALRRVAVAVARAALPPGERLPGGDDRTIDRLEHLLERFSEDSVRHYGAVLWTLEQATRATHGRPFSSLDRDEAERTLARWAVEGNPANRTLAFAVTAPLKVAHFDEEDIYDRLNGRFRFQAVAEHPRWMNQVMDGDDLTEDTEVECDVVVVGTGAGGAVVGKELAQRGHAVLMIEEGRYHTRADFRGRGVDSITRFYRNKGTTGTVGNTFILLPMGKLVGGSTAINTGTCWRTPDWVLNRWVEREGLVELTPDAMAPYFERVEREIEVGTNDANALGGVARVIARGASVLGYSHLPLRRNAPGCDGSGVCDYGCPTDARKSMNLSYVPAALRNNAALYTRIRAERVLIEGGRVVGLVGTSCTTGRQLRVRARATVLSGGTVPTPILLQRQGIHKKLSHIGKNLTIHPATMVSALFDEDIRGYNAIPQGYCVDEFQRRGILLLGASAPIDFGAAQFAFVGKQLMDIMDHYDRVASFGVMVEDEASGRVTSGAGGRPFIFYWLGRRERRLLARGAAILSRIFLAAGAREVWPAVHGHRVVRSAEDIARLENAVPAASDILLSAFHPLGTCRMATSAARGVVSTDHEVFGLPGLFIADGSVVPSSIAVNPQVTIMALSTRAADRIAERLDRAS